MSTITDERPRVVHLWWAGGPLRATNADRYVVTFPTGDVTDPVLAARIRDDKIPPTAFAHPTMIVLDLRGKLVSPAGLKEWIVVLGQRIRAGMYGDSRLVVATSDQDVREMTALLARNYQIPLYLSPSPAIDDILLYGMPAGDLTEADAQTLEQTRAAGSVTTAAALANAVGLQASAANNRLMNLERKGYVLRIRRSRDQGDLFVDSRVPPGTPLHASPRPETRPMRQALVNAGIDSDPYAHPPREVTGDTAESLAEILRRRDKLPKPE